MKILIVLNLILLAFTIKSMATEVVIMDYSDVEYDDLTVYRYGCECECYE